MVFLQSRPIDKIEAHFAIVAVSASVLRAHWQPDQLKTLNAGV